MKGILGKVLAGIALFSILNSLAFAETYKEFGKRTTYFYADANQESFSNLQDSAAAYEQDLKKARNNAYALMSIMIATIAEKN
ncbi:hypothetical protein GCM10011613_22220 [Cellvibrio zantedeschiae]|uniref:Uncharacterized protein n=1 Tax=Cellvibrio zantedeschiae TaxID=1237077 RepID=A0ABQ3B3J0_9GAMM|nr:hypothetical protein [Cellvibrio zantedeschiae]GGY77248.1 hypothetical protein GCM10011613_22220 [Cellvibrio zantedeschiae]